MLERAAEKVCFTVSMFANTFVWSGIESSSVNYRLMHLYPSKPLESEKTAGVLGRTKPISEKMSTRSGSRKVSGSALGSINAFCASVGPDFQDLGSFGSDHLVSRPARLVVVKFSGHPDADLM